MYIRNPRRPGGASAVPSFHGTAAAKGLRRRPEFAVVQRGRRGTADSRDGGALDQEAAALQVGRFGRRSAGALGSGGRGMMLSLGLSRLVQGTGTANGVCR